MSTSELSNMLIDKLFNNTETYNKISNNGASNNLDPEIMKTVERRIYESGQVVFPFEVNADTGGVGSDTGGVRIDNTSQVEFNFLQGRCKNIRPGTIFTIEIDEPLRLINRPTDRIPTLIGFQSSDISLFSSTYECKTSVGRPEDMCIYGYFAGIDRSCVKLEMSDDEDLLLFAKIRIFDEINIDTFVPIVTDFSPPIKQLTELNILWRDSYGRPVDFGGIDHSLTCVVSERVSNQTNTSESGFKRLEEQLQNVVDTVI